MSVPIRTLIVDDNAGHRAALGALMKALDVDAETAIDGIEALEKLQSRVYDLVLMDVTMPRMDGLTAVRQFRSWEDDHAIMRTPIVMVTSHDEPDDRAASLAAGATDHVTKPVALARMLNALELALAP